MVSEFLAGLSAFKSILDVAKGLKDLNDDAARNTALTELTEKILSAKQSQMALIERVSDLEKELEGYETWEREKQRYELKPAGPYTQTLAYSLIESEQDGEHPHQICANCFEDRQRSILQHETRSPGRCDVLLCNRCGSAIYLTGEWQPEHGGGRSPGQAGTWGRKSR